ncbi:hypothetical protein C8R46DRAFT_1033068 [Mycena filopes]|nr:hypothetical protein C8R46DRAFT_1033068 [Mycena filopes]
MVDSLASTTPKPKRRSQLPFAVQRRRTIIACSICRKRKLRCLTTEQPPRNPSARCKRKGLQCEYVASSSACETPEPTVDSAEAAAVTPASHMPSFKWVAQDSSPRPSPPPRDPPSTVLYADPPPAEASSLSFDSAFFPELPIPCSLFDDSPDAALVQSIPPAPTYPYSPRTALPQWAEQPYDFSRRQPSLSHHPPAFSSSGYPPHYSGEPQMDMPAAVLFSNTTFCDEDFLNGFNNSWSPQQRSSEYSGTASWYG